MSLISLIPVRGVHVTDAVAAAGHQCTAASGTTGTRCERSARPDAPPIARYRLHVMPLPELGPDAYAVLCTRHYDQIQRDDRRAAAARAEARAADHPTLF